MRLRWVRGRREDGEPGRDASERALEWLGCDDAGEPIARVVRVKGPLWSCWRLYRAVALDDDARVVELRPSVPADGRWLVVVNDRVVGRAALPLQAVRRAEAALTGS
jgi:hypothetical protein